MIEEEGRTVSVWSLYFQQRNDLYIHDLGYTAVALDQFQFRTGVKWSFGCYAVFTLYYKTLASP